MKKFLITLLMLGMLSANDSMSEKNFKYGFEAYMKKDYNTAINFFQKACDNSFGGGCAMLGMMYATGTGIKQDYFKARELYEKACDGKVHRGCLGLGLLYETGSGVMQDYSKA